MGPRFQALAVIPPAALIGMLAGASIGMVVAVVQFSASLIADPEPEPAARWWGLAYSASWTAIAAIILRGAAEAHLAWPQALALMALVVGGWTGFHAFWFWFWFSLAEANAATSGTPVPAEGRLALARRCGQVAAGAVVAVALALIELGAGRALVAAVALPGRKPLMLMIAVAAAGGALLISGGVRLVLSSGRPMSGAEIDEAFRRQTFGPRGRTGPLRGRASVYRHFGPAVGATGDQEVSLLEMKAAWRSGAWRRDRRWQIVFMMTAGGLMMIYGGFGAAVVAGPPAAQLLCGGALAYATFQLVAAARRA